MYVTKNSILSLKGVLLLVKMKITPNFRALEMFFRRVLPVITCLINLSFGVYAQAVTDTINLSSVEIVGSISPVRFAIKKSAVDLAPLPDIGVLLRSSPGVSGIRKGGSAVDPVIRGFRFSQLAVVAGNGIKVEGGCPNRMDPVTSHFESDDIESVEIIKGPYSFTLGPSLGGLVRLKLYKPSPYDNFQVHAKFRTSVSSNPAGYNQYVRINGGSQRVYFGISGSYKSFGDYRDGNGTRVSAAFSKFNYGAALGFIPRENHEVILSLYRNYGRDIRYPALPMDEIVDNTTIVSADYHVKFMGGIIRKLDVSFYNSDVYHEMDNRFRPAYSQVVAPYKGLMQAVAKVDAANTGGRFEAHLVTGNHELRAGADLEAAGKSGGRVTTMIMNMNGIETTSVKNTNLWKNARLLNSGLFGEYSLQLKKLKFVASARLDYNVASSRDTLRLLKNEQVYFDETRSDYVNFSANAGISKQIGQNITLSIFAGRGMRSPDLTERFIKYLVVGYDNYDYLGNPKLLPEKNYQTDVILNVNTIKAGKLTLSGYYSMVQDFISGVILPASVTTPKTMGAPGVKQFMNTGNAWFTGFEATYLTPEYKGFNADIAASFTYGIHEKTIRNYFENGQVIGTQQIRDDAMQEIAPFEVRTVLNYTFYHRKMQASFSSRFVAAQRHVSLSYYESATPGFVLINLAYDYKFNKTVHMAAGIQNLLNKPYYEHLNRRIVGTTDKLPEPGRNFYLNLIIVI